MHLGQAGIYFHHLQINFISVLSYCVINKPANCALEKKNTLLLYTSTGGAFYSPKTVLPLIPPPPSNKIPPSSDLPIVILHVHLSNYLSPFLTFFLPLQHRFPLYLSSVFLFLLNFPLFSFPFLYFFPQIATANNSHNIPECIYFPIYTPQLT